MKFLAILKDSFREAIDCKALYVLLALSGVVILVVASLSFKPVPPEKMMADVLSGNVFGSLANLGNPGAFEGKGFVVAQAGPFHVDSVRATSGPDGSPDSDYALTVSMTVTGPKEAAAKLRQEPSSSIEKLKKEFETSEKFGIVKITDIRLLAPAKGAPGDKIVFEVQTQATEATRRLWLHEPSLVFGAVTLPIEFPLGLELFIIAKSALDWGSWIALLVAVIITAFFIPNMLRKGTIDLLLVKPIHRWAILIFKYLGGLSFIFLNTSVAVVGIWLALGLRTGVWANTFLLMIFVITFFFAILYAVSMLAGVVTRSTVVAILTTCVAWFLFFVIGTVHLVFEVQQKMEEKQNVPADKRWGENVASRVLQGVHKVTPRTADLNVLSEQILLEDFLRGDLRKIARGADVEISWGESLTVSGIFIAVMLGLACWWFATKDY